MYQNQWYIIVKKKRTHRKFQLQLLNDLVVFLWLLPSFQQKYKGDRGWFDLINENGTNFNHFLLAFKKYNVLRWALYCTVLYQYITSSLTGGR